MLRWATAAASVVNVRPGSSSSMPGLSRSAAVISDCAVSPLPDRIARRRNDASDATVVVLHDQLRAIDRARIDWSAVDASGDPGATLAAARHVLGAGTLRTGG